MTHIFRWNSDTVTGPAGDIRPELVDLLIDLYCDWRTACAEVWRAYERWSDASGADRAVAFASYAGALDREQSACDSYAAQIHAIAARLAGRKVAHIRPQLIETGSDA